MTPYRRRFGEDFRGPIIPFGAYVKYFPSNPSDKAMLHQFGSKVLDGIFLGYKQNAGGGWEGDTLFVLNWDEVNNADHVSEIYERDLHAHEVLVQKENG